MESKKHYHWTCTDNSLSESQKRLLEKEEIKKKPYNCPKCGSEYIIISHTARKAACKGNRCGNMWDW